MSKLYEGEILKDEILKNIVTCVVKSIVTNIKKRVRSVSDNQVFLMIIELFIKWFSVKHS